MSHTVTAQKNTSKKAKALLAGGLVLGVGAAVTFASWTDQESASATFTSGDFKLESNAHDGKGFENRSDIGGSRLNFEIPQAGKLGPNEKIAAPLSLRLDADTTHDAVVTMSAEVDGQIEGLRYQAIPVTSLEQCNTDLTSPISPLPLGTVHGAVPTMKLKAGEGDAPGNHLTLCFVVTADGKLEQSASADATWTFHAKLPDSAN